MLKRSIEESEDSVRDTPDVIANRRRAKVSPRFRRGDAASSTGAQTSASPSPFASFKTKPTSTAFTFGASVATRDAGSNKSGNAVLQSASVAGEPGLPLTDDAQQASGHASTSAPQQGGFKFSVAPPPAGSSPPSRGQLSPWPQPATDRVLNEAKEGPRQTTSTHSGSMAQGANVSHEVIASTEPFGDGLTAALGVRLNKRFASWVSHQVGANAAAFLDAGMRDYVAHAASIRERVEFSEAGEVSTTGKAFKHSPSITQLSVSRESTISSQTSPSSSAARPDPGPSSEREGIPVPTQAPNPATRTALASGPVPAPSFSSSNSLGMAAAPLGAKFSFALPASATPSAARAISTQPSSTFTGGFNFGTAGSASAGTPAPSPAAFTGFQLPGGLSIPAAPPTGASANTEEDGMPKEDPAQLQRAPGEEDEEIVQQFRAKLYRFKVPDGQWGDLGVGQLRLMKHQINDSRRLLLRNDIGKVLLNAALSKGMEVTKTKNSVKLVANLIEHGPSPIQIKVTKNELEALHTAVVNLLPT